MFEHLIYWWVSGYYAPCHFGLLQQECRSSELSSENICKKCRQYLLGIFNYQIVDIKLEILRRKSLCISVSHTGLQNFGRKEDPFYILYVYAHYSKAWKTFRVERLKILWKLLNNKEVLSSSDQRVFMTRHGETCFDLFRLWLG